MVVKRADVFYADLDPVIGSEQSGIRPVLIVQNDIGNKYSPTVIVIAITSKDKPVLPTHISIQAKYNGLPKNSVILVEQIRTLDKSRLKEKICTLDNEIMNKVKEAIKISFSIRASFKDIFPDW
ncbi:MAG: type II toxin-antitoxin system PemK/MazF family toxin [Clostridia bacterium]